MLHIGQWVSEETLSINNLGGFLFQVDLEKSNNVSKVTVVIIRVDFYFWQTLKNIRLH